jgi:penicillin-binding protein 1A
MSSGRTQFRGPEANIGDAIQKLSAGGAAAPDALPAWQQALRAVKLPLYDVHWEPAVILDKGGGKRGDGNIRVGLRDGRVLPLNAPNWGAK